MSSGAASRLGENRKLPGAVDAAAPFRLRQGLFQFLCSLLEPLSAQKDLLWVAVPGQGRVRNRRIFLVAAPSREGRLTEPTAARQPRRQEPLFMPQSRP